MPSAHVSFRGGLLTVTPIDLEPGQQAQLKERNDGVKIEPGRSQVSFRVSNDPAERFPAVLTAADDLLAVTRT